MHKFMARKSTFFRLSHGLSTYDLHHDAVPEVVSDDWKLVLIRCHKVCYSEPCIFHHHVIIAYVKSSWTFDAVRSLYNSPRYIVDSVEYISSFQVDNNHD